MNRDFITNKKKGKDLLNKGSVEKTPDSKGKESLGNSVLGWFGGDVMDEIKKMSKSQPEEKESY